MNIDFTTTGQKPEVTLYKNPKYLPDYTENLTVVDGPFTLTPRNMGFREGYFDMQLDVDTIMGCNYLKIDRGQTPLFAYIDRVEHLSGDKLHRIHYRVDPLRTYKDKITLGPQFVVRSPEPTNLYDEFLGSTDPYPEIVTRKYDFGERHGRVLVVQTRRRGGGGTTVKSNVPGNPSMYNFHVTKYDARDPLDSSPIESLLSAIQDNDPSHVVTMYSVPDFDFTGLTTSPSLYINEEDSVSGFHFIVGGDTHNQRFVHQRGLNIPVEVANKDRLTESDASITLVFPDAGVMEIPSELWDLDELVLRRDIDIFSGHCNYSLRDKDGVLLGPSVRGGGTNSIPVVGDPMETYLSQNQNSLSVSMLSDVATIAGGAALTATGKGALLGGGMMVAGGRGIVSQQARTKDAGRTMTNPPAFLGSAMAANFSNQFMVVEKYSKVTNRDLVHQEVGYPYGLIKELTIPSSGYIQTQGCNLKSDGTVPQWAITELNSIFDQGLKVE